MERKGVERLKCAKEFRDIPAKERKRLVKTINEIWGEKIMPVKGGKK